VEYADWICALLPFSPLVAGFRIWERDTDFTIVDWWTFQNSVTGRYVLGPPISPCELVLVLDTRSKTLGPIERAAGFLKPDIDARKTYEARRAPSPATSRDCGITNLVKKIPFYFSSARVREGELLQQPH
jgi:hypothetical protein